jgi:hypothetical protein
MIVELVGAPGAGKTHLAPLIAARCGVPVIKVGRLGQRHFYFALYAITHWRLTREIFREFRRQEREHPHLRSVRKWRRFTSMGAKTAKARLIGGGLVDEGLFQGLLKIFEDPATPDQLDYYLRLIGTPPDRVYFIEAGDSERYERMQARNYFPRRDLGEDNWQHWHKSFTANVAMIKPILLQRYRAEIIENAGPIS